jgi:hypothetical protein
MRLIAKALGVTYEVEIQMNKISEIMSTHLHSYFYKIPARIIMSIQISLFYSFDHPEI